MLELLRQADEQKMPVLPFHICRVFGQLQKQELLFCLGGYLWQSYQRLWGMRDLWRAWPCTQNVPEGKTCFSLLRNFLFFCNNTSTLSRRWFSKRLLGLTPDTHVLRETWKSKCTKLSSLELKKNNKKKNNFPDVYSKFAVVNFCCSAKWFSCT